MNKNKLSCDYIIVYSNPGNTQYINIMDNAGMSVAVSHCTEKYSFYIDLN